MTPQEAHRAWKQAEEAYHEESRRYFVLRDASAPFEQVKATAELTALRDAAQAARRMPTSKRWQSQATEG